MMTKGMLLTGAATLALQLAVTPAAAQTTAPTTTTAASAKSTKPIKPLYRRIRAFSGDIDPFYRRIRAFWGDVDPFYRRIRAFWGDLDPVLNASVAGAPTVTSLAPFWEDLGAQWDGISADWQSAGAYDVDSARYGRIGEKLGTLVDTSERTWGAAVLAQTGKSFDEGFADPLFAKFGISRNAPESLARLSAAEQSEFFINWYDGLMSFSGTDHVDHWMTSINWSPKLTQTQGGGSDAVIGLVDFFIAGDKDIQSKLIYAGGVSTFSNGHGAGVGSLIVSSHDGKGVMGIAPKAKLAVYNPFDSTGSADWASVRTGILEVSKRGAAVINLSLGVPGTTFSADWRGVLSSDGVKDLKDRALFVIAAGNDGVTQTANINMKDTLDMTYIVVGSVDPTGKISEFSNRPGTACLLDDKDCKRDPSKSIAEQLKLGGPLMNRFIVAPGELILVSDDNGGITRQTGTSLAAPLVSGAIALIHDRWPWMKKYPRDVAAMILGSAKDLGAPGVDPIYGVGLLDVEASQSPLNFDALKIYLVEGSRTTEQRVSAVQDTGIKTTWETKGSFFSAFEKIQDGERDFLIPLSSRLIGTMRNGQYFQDYLYERMTAWMSAGGTAPAPRPRLGFDGQGMRLPTTVGGWNFSMRGRVSGPSFFSNNDARMRLSSTVFAEAPTNRLGLAFGNGEGAAAIGGGGFNMASDYNPLTGGANPLLGFASGGSHVAVTAGVAPAVQLSMGVTENRPDRFRDIDGLTQGPDRTILAGLAPYRSRASHVRVDYQPVRSVTLSLAATQLAEPNALLGVRSLQPNDFAGGGTTSGVTVTSNVALGGGFSFAASATGTSSKSDRRDAALRVGDAGLLGSSFQVALAKSGILNGGDSLRLSIAQPLTIERGKLDFDSVQVVDRETGEIGVVRQSFDIAGQRRFVAEATYGLTAMQGRAMFNVFGRGELTQVDAQTPRFMVGSQARLAF